MPRGRSRRRPRPAARPPTPARTRTRPARGPSGRSTRPVGGGRQFDGGDQLAGLEGGVPLGRVPGQPVQARCMMMTRPPPAAGDVHGRVQRGQRDRHVGRVGRHARAASSPGWPGWMRRPRSRGSPSPGRRLLHARGDVLEIRAAGPLQEVAADRGHVPDLAGRPGQDGAGPAPGTGGAPSRRRPGRCCGRPRRSARPPPDSPDAAVRADGSTSIRWSGAATPSRIRSTRFVPPAQVHGARAVRRRTAACLVAPAARSENVFTGPPPRSRPRC